MLTSKFWTQHFRCIAASPHTQQVPLPLGPGGITTGVGHGSLEERGGCFDLASMVVNETTQTHKRYKHIQTTRK